MFYKFLCVPHSRSSTQSWGSVLPSIVETRDQNSRGCPLLFSNRNLGSFFVHRGQKSYTPTAFGKLWTTPGVKPIFHCDAKYLALGVGVGQCPRRQNFVLEIPTCWYILVLPNAKICVTPKAKPKICVIPDANQWNIGGVGSQTQTSGHVHFIFLCRFHSRWVANANPISSAPYCKNRRKYQAVWYVCMYVCIHLWRGVEVCICIHTI